MINVPDPFEHPSQVNSQPSVAQQGAPQSTQTHYATANGVDPNHAPPATHPHTDPSTDPSVYPTFAAAYGAATQPYGVHSYPSYVSGYGQYGTTPYGQTVGAAYSQPYSAYPYSAYGRTFTTSARLQATNPAPVEGGPGVNGVHQTGSQVLSNIHDAMARFARVSAHIDEVLRHLHMLFDAVFGLGYSLSAMREEARLWLANKTGPVAVACRLFRAFTSLWRILSLFFLSPMAGRYSPVAVVLRILGLVPDHINYYHNTPEDPPVPNAPSEPQHSVNAVTFQSHAPEEDDFHRLAETYRLGGADPRDFSNM